MLFNNRHKIVFFLLAIVALVQVGCLEKEEGCLNPNATNLDVTADVNADCVFPSLLLNVSHQWYGSAVGDTSSFRLNEERVFDSGDTIVFTKFDFYISNVVIGDEPQLTVYDTVLSMDGTYFKDDLTILSPASFSFETGHVITFGSYEGLQFDIGYDERWLDADTTVLRESEAAHPWLSERLLGDNFKRFICEMSYHTIVDGDTTTVEIEIDTQDVLQITKEGSFTTYQANNGVVTLLIDYYALFGEVDLTQSDMVAIKNEILMNMNDAILVFE